MARKNFIQKAIKHPGSLSRLVGGKPSQHMAKVRELASEGTPLQKKQALFFLKVLNRVKRK